MGSFDVQTSTWRKSRHSIGNGNCVQVAAARDTVMVQDSADSASPVISYSVRAWRAFVAAAKAGSLSEPR
jgi:hypothetical protein